MPRLTSFRSLAILLLLIAHQGAYSADWSRFRGPNGAGLSGDPAPPIHWGDNQNIAWKVDLPGPGSSSPIIVGDKLLLTCWTGYGLSREEPGDQTKLVRHLLCIDRHTGETLWRRSVASEHTEEDYQGMLAQHGYASHTPVSDGERVFAYFGRSGMVAYDLPGNELWRFNCGQGAGAKEWGSAASPILYDNLVIVAALAESSALIALDKASGEEAWRYELEGLNGSWSTPVLVESKEGRIDLLLAAPQKMVGLDPATGSERWTTGGVDHDSVSTSPLVHDDMAYLLAGRGGSVAVRAGGEGDANDTHFIWRGAHRGGIGMPIYFEGRLYWVNPSGINCIDAATGDRIYQARFEKATLAADPAPEPPEGRPRGRRGRFRTMPYSSPVAVGDLLYAFARSGEAYVVRLGEEFEQIATNLLGDGGDFSATPALSDGALYMRSSKMLYCIKAEE